MPAGDALAAARAALVAATAALDGAAAELEHADDPWLDLGAAARVVPVTRDTLARWAREGRLQAVTAERGRLVTRRSWLDAAMAAAPYTPRRDSAPDPDEHDAAVAKHIKGALRIVR